MKRIIKIILLLLTLSVIAVQYEKYTDIKEVEYKHEEEKENSKDDYKYKNEDEYKSKEEDEYYKKLEHIKFDFLSNEEFVLRAKELIEYHKITDYTPYDVSLSWTPYQDSIFEIKFDLDNKEFTYPKSEYIAGIDKNSIIKQEKKGNLESFIYTSNKYDVREGIWIAFSKDNGNSWEHLYTGISQSRPLNLKWYSKTSLFKSETELQIEAAIVRQLTISSRYNPAPYEVLEDGFLLVFNLDDLRKDSDLDGLTDIEEQSLYTDPNNVDTDGDKIPDDLDLNPHFSSNRTDKTVIFEKVIEGEIMLYTPVEFSISDIPPIAYATDTTETLIIIADDIHLQEIQPKWRRVILISAEKYRKQSFRNTASSISISPLFKVDDEKDTYIFRSHSGGESKKYLVIKTKKGWEVILIGYSIAC
ncbi:hypothetical protein V9L05_12130 [Bernardetia sp. Wsw4-3y2]|uniref:hypothetical protein n=1 Tax=Bernardetia sp. Wsw4-3y2 TaxID=3127471 RepID=UPI0030CE67C3